MTFFTLLQNNLILALTLTALLGLCVGSFLNVVIHRTPLIMQQEWRQECSQFMANQPDIDDALRSGISNITATDHHISLSHPASRCPNCGHHISWFENIPVLSWLWLKGRCRGCGTGISWRYPLVEITTAVLSVLVVMQFGVSVQSGAALLLLWTLIALTGIDFDTQLLPDRMTLPLAALGLLVNAQSWFVSPSQAIWGYVLGFMSLWLVVKLFYLITKKHGMGQGDFKLLAALGAWLGAGMLPLIILLSSLIGAMVGTVLLRRAGESQPFAFGPYIAMAGVVALLYGADIIDWYLHLYG